MPRSTVLLPLLLLAALVLAACGDTASTDAGVTTAAPAGPAEEEVEVEGDRVDEEVAGDPVEEDVADVDVDVDDGSVEVAAVALLWTPWDGPAEVIADADGRQRVLDALADTIDDAGARDLVSDVDLDAQVVVVAPISACVLDEVRLGIVDGEATVTWVESPDVVCDAPNAYLAVHPVAAELLDADAPVAVERLPS